MKLKLQLKLLDKIYVCSGQLQICTYKKKSNKSRGVFSGVISHAVRGFTVKHAVDSKPYLSLTAKCDFQHSVKIHHYFIQSQRCIPCTDLIIILREMICVCICNCFKKKSSLYIHEKGLNCRAAGLLFALLLL